MVDKDRKIIVADDKGDKRKKSFAEYFNYYFSNRLSANNVKFEIRFLKEYMIEKVELEPFATCTNSAEIFDLDTTPLMS